MWKKKFDKSCGARGRCTKFGEFGWGWEWKKYGGVEKKWGYQTSCRQCLISAWGYRLNQNTPESQTGLSAVELHCGLTRKKNVWTKKYISGSVVSIFETGLDVAWRVLSGTHRDHNKANEHRVGHSLVTTRETERTGGVLAVLCRGGWLADEA